MEPCTLCSPSSPGVSPHTGTSAPEEHEQEICLSGKHWMSAALLALQRVLPSQEQFVVYQSAPLWMHSSQIMGFLSPWCPDCIQLPQNVFLCLISASFVHTSRGQLTPLVCQRVGDWKCILYNAQRKAHHWPCQEGETLIPQCPAPEILEL